MRVVQGVVAEVYLLNGLQPQRILDVLHGTRPLSADRSIVYRAAMAVAVAMWSWGIPVYRSRDRSHGTNIGVRAR
jgi:hypothetical protein